MARLLFRSIDAKDAEPREIDLSINLFHGGWHIGGEQTLSFLRDHGILKAEIPSHLYHYTTAPGFFGIVTSGVFWASNYSYLNDHSETKYLFSLIQNELRQLLARTKVAFFESGLLSVDQFKPSVESCFVCSFSENNDQLSQWRGYAEGGYSIGVPRGAIEELMKSDGFHVARCVYDEQTAQDTAAKLASLLVDQISKVENETEARSLFVHHRHFAWRLSPFFKHPAFSEEKEWRVFRFKHHAAENVFRRPSSAGLISYLNVPVFSRIPRLDVSEPLDEPRIVCSPGLDTIRDTEEPVRLIHEAHGIRASSKASNIPYRTSK